MPSHVLVNHLLVIGGFILAITVLGRIIKEHRPPGTTLAWIVTILLVPYVGVPLYFLFGGRKVRKLAALKEDVDQSEATLATYSTTDTERILRSTGASAATNGNKVRLITTSNDALQSLLAMIENARSSIWLETYIVKNDPIGQKILQALTARARDGIEVKLLVDSWGSAFHLGRFLQPLREAGGEVGIFLPVIPVRRQWSINLRNHRKIWLCDRKIAIIGGRNIANEYLGSGEGIWNDFNLEIIGPAVRSLEKIFASDWNFATGKTLEVQKLTTLPSVPLAKTGCIQIVAAGPDTPSERLYDGILTAVLESKTRIWCVTPYFIPDETLVQALMLSARLGRDVRIIVPEKSNHWVADFARGSYLRQLTKAGVRCYAHHGEMVHTKLLLIDDHIAVAGSANLDIRSLFLNYEVAAFCYSPEEITGIARHFLRLLSECSLMATACESKPGQLRRWAEDIGRLFAPLL